MTKIRITADHETPTHFFRAGEADVAPELARRLIEAGKGEPLEAIETPEDPQSPETPEDPNPPVETPEDPQPRQSPEDPPTYGDKPIEKLTKPELIAALAECGVNASESTNKSDLVEKLRQELS